MKHYLWFIFLGLSLLACSNDDDICVSGEATPRIKLKFKDQNNKLKTLDTLYVDVDYGNGKVSVITQKAKVDSVLIPLRVDAHPFTEIFVRQRKDGNISTVKILYDIQSEYVSPACGFKRLYKNVNTSLVTANPVTDVNLNQTEIIDENKTHIYLIF